MFSWVPKSFLRWLLTGTLVLFALLFWYMTLTVPMISATAPAIIAIALSIMTYFAWPKHRSQKEIK